MLLFGCFNDDFDVDRGEGMVDGHVCIHGHARKD